MTKIFQKFLRLIFEMPRSLTREEWTALWPPLPLIQFTLKNLKPDRSVELRKASMLLLNEIFLNNSTDQTNCHSKSHWHESLFAIKKNDFSELLNAN